MIGHVSVIHHFYHPLIDLDALPEEEREAALYIHGNLTQLTASTSDFRATLELFLHAHELKRGGADLFKMAKWIGIAGRNGAIVAHGFWMGMQAINATNAPSVWGKADMNARNEATKLFAAEFPSLAKIRKTAAHPVELSATPTELKRHGLKESYAGLSMQLAPGTFVQGGMHVSSGKLTYTSSFEGQMVSYDLSDEKAQALERVAELYCQTFYPLEHPITAAQREADRAWREQQQKG